MISKRVAAYQHQILELLWLDHLTYTIPTEEISYNENLLILNDQFYQRILDLCEENLTQKQLQIMELMSQGKTQTEIARAIGTNQSSVNLNIHGIHNGRRYTGGLVWKIKNCIVADPICQQLYQEMELAQDVLYCAKHNIKLSIYNSNVESPANFYNFYPIIQQQVKNRNKL
jgi:hypothetical protein